MRRLLLRVLLLLLLSKRRIVLHRWQRRRHAVLSWGWKTQMLRKRTGRERGRERMRAGGEGGLVMGGRGLLMMSRGKMRFAALLRVVCKARGWVEEV